MRENLLAILGEESPAFEIIVVADRADDRALAVVAEACRSFDRQTSPLVRVVIAGAATDSGQKVHSLRAAVGEADPQNAVFAFVDTDARPSSRWLQSLVAPLSDKSIGAATGYRWFVARRVIAVHMRADWMDSIASTLGAQRDKSFCWG